MAEIRNEKDLEKWLEGKPLEWGVALATRAALRCLPALYEDAEELFTTKGWQIDYMLPLFRSLQVAHAYSITGAEALQTNADIASTLAAKASNKYWPNCKIAAEVAGAACSAADAVLPFSGPTVISKIALSVVHGSRAIQGLSYVHITHDFGLSPKGIDRLKNYLGTSFDVIAEDASRLELEGGRIRSSLWSGNSARPPWVEIGWGAIEGALLFDGLHWQVWIDWYRDILDGEHRADERNRPASPELELKRARISELDWTQGPAHVNPILKRIEDEYWEKQAESDPAPPGQVPAGLQFGGDPDAPVLIIDHPGNGLNTSQDQRDAHWAVVDKARLLDGLCDSSNSLSRLRGFVRRLLDVAGASLEDVRVRAFWSAMNSLRAREQADQAARAAADPDTPPFSEEVAAALNDLVSELNLFAAHEPKLARLDLLTSDPSLRQATPEALEARESLVAAARRAPQVIDPAAAKTLEQANEDAKGGTVANGRADAFAQFSTLNLTIELLRRAKAFGKRVKDGATKVAGIAIETISFIQRHEPLIRSAILALPPGGLQATLFAILDSIMMIKL